LPKIYGSINITNEEVTMSNTGGTEQPVSVESKVKFTDAAVEEAKLSLDESGIRTTDSEFKAATATGAFSSTGKHSLKR
jgi:hypothetical protein